MYNILSLVRNNITRNNVFLPQVDFGLFAFGINKDSLEGSGPKRERAQVDLKTDEPQLETQVALPSPLSLEDFIMPSNAGSLENKAFFVSYASPSLIFDYFFFGPNPKIMDSNPKYLVYRAIEFPAQNYASYALPQNGATYQSQAAYESATKFVFSQAVQQAEVKPYSFPLVKPTDLYKAQFAYAETNAVPNYDMPRYTIALNHDFWLTLAKTHYSFSLRHAKLSQSAHPQNLNLNYDMPKHAIEALSSNFWQSSSYFVGTYSQVLPKYAVNNLDNSFSKPIARSYARKDLPKFATQKEIPRKTLDFIVARTPNIELSPFGLTYTVILPFQMPTNPIKTRGVEFIAQAFFVYAKQNQQTLYNETRQPNYDAPQQSINIMSSGFWKNSSYYKGKYRGGDGQKLQEHSTTGSSSGNNYYRRKRNPKNNEKYELKQQKRAHTKERTHALINSEPKQKYEQRKSYGKEKHYDETTDKKYEAKHKHKGSQVDEKDEKPKEKEVYGDRSKVITRDGQESTDTAPVNYEDSICIALSYLGTAAGIAFLGAGTFIANTLSLFKRVQEEQSIPFQQKTLESITVPNEIVFTQQFKEGITSLLKQFEQLYGSVGLVIRDNKTREHFAYNAKSSDDKKPKPAPSIDKLGIIIAAQYLIQEGLLDSKKTVEYDMEKDKDIILEREIKDYPIFGANGAFSFNYLRSLIIRDSANTATNLALKFIGEGDVYRGIERVTCVLDILGIKGVKIEVPYNKIFDYEKNTATEEGAESLARYILQDGNLKPEYLDPIREGMENERWMEAFRNMLPGIKSGTKVTMYKRGMGFVAYFGDYSVAFLASNSNEQIYRDEATSASTIERHANPIFFKTSRKFEEMFKFFGQHLFKLTYQQSNTKPA